MRLGEFHPLSPHSLAMYRIAFAIWIFRYFPDTPWWLEGLPQDFFDPPFGPLALMSTYPDVEALRWVRRAGLLSALALGVGFLTPLVSALLSVTLLIMAGSVDLFGKVDHHYILSCVPLVMACSGWGARFSVDGLWRNSEIKTRDWPAGVVAFFLAFTFFSAGLVKALTGWLDFSGSAIKGHVYYFWEVFGRDGEATRLLLQHLPAALWKAADLGVVAFEIGFLVALVSLRVFRWYCLLAVGFHLMISYLLLIDLKFFYIIYALFLPWNRLFPRAMANALHDRRRQNATSPETQGAGIEE